MAFTSEQFCIANVAVVLKFLPLILICMSCSSSDDEHRDRVAQRQANFASQTGAPSPDYDALLNEPSLSIEKSQHLEPTSPPPADAKAIGEVWIARLRARHALLGSGLAGKGPDGAVELIDTGLTKVQFLKWVKDKGWDVPRHIRWSFVSEMSLPSTSVSARKSVKIWPASSARTGLQLQALYQGKIELRDGCFYVGEFNKPVDKLAWFHAEMGLYIDHAGYFVLRDRVSGQTLARIGERVNWGGPANAEIDTEDERELHAACGPGEIYIVGSPQSSERFLTQYPHLRHPEAPPPPPQPAH